MVHTPLKTDDKFIQQELSFAKPAPRISTLNEYQQIADSTSNHNLDNQIELAVLALGLAGESGEAADHIKKYLGHGHELDKAKLLKEMGDVVWYVAVLADRLGFSLQQVAQVNVDKLAARYPNGFNVQDSKNRKASDT